MPGTFSKSSRPLLPGAYFNWIAQTAVPIPEAVGSIVAVPFTSDWGPAGSPTLVQSFQDYLATFGPTVGTPGYYAVWQAFQGEGGYEGRYGAGGVLCYRMVGSAGASSAHTLQNTTPASAVTITAKYPGSYGNNIAVTTQDHIADTSKNELLVYVGSVKVETYVYPDTALDQLVAQIAATSNWITSTLVLNGVALANVTSVSLTAGNDGTTTTGTDWTNMQNAMATQNFGILAPYGLTDGTIIPSLFAWAAGPSDYSSSGLNAAGRRFQVVLGGVADESASTAVTAAGVVLGGDFCRLGMGHVIDSILLDASGNPVSLSTAQFCPRIAGVLASRGEVMSLTGARFPGCTIVNPAIPSDQVTTLLGGVMVLSQDSDPISPTFLLGARTTFTKGAPGTTNADPAFPYLVYRNPKFMRTMQNIEQEWTQWATQTLIGKLPVNNKTRDAAIAEMQARLTLRESAGIIQSGWTVSVDSNPPPSDSDEFIALVIGLLFGRSVEQAYFSVSVG